jgi:hypothetical protein
LPNIKVGFTFWIVSLLRVDVESDELIHSTPEG